MGRCAVSRRKLDRRQLCLCRWYTSKRFSDRSSPVGADSVVLLAPGLADALDAALDVDASQASAAAVLGNDACAAIDERFRWMRAVAGGAWTSA